MGPNPLDDAALGLGEIGVRAEAKAGAEILEESGASQAAVTINRKNGLEYQKAVLESENLTANTSRLTKEYGFRIPDFMDDFAVGEIKSGKKISFSAQIRDMMKFADESGRTFILYVRNINNVSRPLREVIKKSGGAIKPYPGF